MAAEETLGATELGKTSAEDWTEILAAEEDCAGGTIATAEVDCAGGTIATAEEDCAGGTIDTAEDC